MTGQFDLSGKAGLVVGAATPVGRAIAVGLAEAGANLALTSLSRTTAEEFAVNSALNELWAMGRRGLALAIDVTSEAEVEQAVERARSELGRLDLAVVYPHYPLHKPFLETEEAEWAQTTAVTLTGAGHVIRSAGRSMVEQQRGRIVTVASLLGERGVANSAAYSAAQAGLLGMTRALALEWARTGVTVNAVALGWVEDEPGPTADPQVRADLERFLPMRRLVRPAEAVGAIVYLVSDAAFVTGEVIVVDGGLQTHG